MALEDYEKDMARCARCSLCKWLPLDQVKGWDYAYVCPSISRYNFHAYSGGGRLIIGYSLIKDRIEYSDGLLDIIYRCQMCDACDVSCKYNRDMEPLEVLYELRAKLVDDGQLLPQHIPVMEGLRKEDNMLQKPKAERGKWAEGLDVKDITKEKSEVLYHAGCRYSFDEDLGHIPRTTINVFKKAGVDIGIFPGRDELCCGGRAYEMGYQSELTKYAEHHVEEWRTSGVKTVVTSCSDCYYAFKILYDRIGMKPESIEILHTTEFLDRLIKEGRLKISKEVPITVTYHDPCHLGRKGEPWIHWHGVEKKVLGQLTVHSPIKEFRRGTLGVYEPPREVLLSIPGVELIEMPRNREYAWCCGAGGGVKEAYPDFAIWTANERIREARSTGAEAMVTACSWCERNLIDAVKESNGGFKIHDVIELVQQAI